MKLIELVQNFSLPDVTTLGIESCMNISYKPECLISFLILVMLTQAQELDENCNVFSLSFKDPLAVT